MSRSNFNRSAGASLVPVFARMSDSEREEAIIARMGKKRYYTNKRRAALIKKDESADSWFRPEAVREHQRKVKLKTERLKMIKKVVEL